MTNELAVPGASALVGAEKGESLRQGFDPKDLLLPRVVLLQHTPPKTLEVPDDVFKAGRIISSLTVAELPKLFVPIAMRTKWIRFNAQEAGKPGFDPAVEPGAKIWESENPLDPRVQAEGQWGPNNEAPLATKILEFFVLFEGYELPMLLSFSKTSFKAGQQLLTNAMMGREMYSYQYELGSKIDQNAQKQKFAVYTIRQAGQTPEDRYRMCGSLFAFFARKGKDIKVHGEDHIDLPTGEAKTDERPF